MFNSNSSFHSLKSMLYVWNWFFNFRVTNPAKVETATKAAKEGEDDPFSFRGKKNWSKRWNETQKFWSKRWIETQKLIDIYFMFLQCHCHFTRARFFFYLEFYFDYFLKVFLLTYVKHHYYESILSFFLWSCIVR